MSDSVYERDARRIGDAIAAMRRGETSTAGIYDYSRTLVDIDMRRREAYSYGRHFPLFRYVPASGRRKELFVVNGDESPRSGRGWGGSRTPDHMSDTRRLIAATGADSVVIPFSALEGAGIDIDSVRPVHVRPDENWTETRRAASIDDLPDSLRRSLGESWSSVTGPDASGAYSWDVRRHRLGDCLFSAVREGKRSRFLSSFDYEEPAPMYFLVQVPRGAGDTVETAIDSLAPRAVWAARARNIPVYRQGDIFFIETRMTDLDLELRVITARARLTMLDRDARPRRGETGYVRPLTAAETRRMRAMVRAEYLRITRDARTQLEHRDAPRAGPKTEKGSRARWAKVRAGDARDLEVARANLRRATLGGRPERYSHYGEMDRYAPVQRYTRMSPLQYERATIAARVKRAREALETVQDRAARNAMGRAAARDVYRAPLTAGPAAIVAMRMARSAARAKFYPQETGAGYDAHRRAVRNVLSIYGTAHTAREVARVRGGAVYVRGKVSHRPELDDGRPSRWDTRPEHRPLELRDDCWYLAVRNRVPRSRA